MSVIIVIMTKLRDTGQSAGSRGKRRKGTTRRKAGHWQLKDAKARLSEVLQCAEERPQTVTVHGKPKAVVVSAAEFARLQQPQTGSVLVELFDGSPLRGISIENDRIKAPVRDIDL